jgi:hypothetical protein
VDFEYVGNAVEVEAEVEEVEEEEEEEENEGKVEFLKRFVHCVSLNQSLS